MTGLVNWPQESNIAGIRLRFTQPGPRRVEIHEQVLAGPGRQSSVWVANAHHFNHPYGPLLRTNIAYRACIGLRDGDPSGAEARELIREQARRLFVPCLAEFTTAEGECTVYLIRTRPRWYRLCCDSGDGAGPGPVCDFTHDGSRPVWHRKWGTTSVTDWPKVAWAAMRAPNLSTRRRR